MGSGLGSLACTTVNLLNGNALTVLPLMEWNPVGPPLRFALYHNSAAAGSARPRRHDRRMEL